MAPFNMKSAKRVKIFRPSQKFWEMWAVDKAYLKAEGVRVIKTENRFYVIVPANFREEEKSSSSSSSDF